MMSDTSFGLLVCVFLFFMLFCILAKFSIRLRFYLQFKDTRGVGVGEDRQNGPKRCQMVVWALGVSFLLCVFSKLTSDSILFRFYLCVKGMRRAKVGLNDG